MLNPRIVFMGSPGFALPTLQALANHYPVVGVVTQPDRPAGRGRRLASPPVKTLAAELGIPVLQPKRLRSDQHAKEQIWAWKPDVIVVVAFGQILKSDILRSPPFGCLNVHASLLPRWRGVSPIQAAIRHGDSETGVTIMLMDEGIDTGPILAQRAIPITPQDTGGSLSEKLARLGAELLLETLPNYLNGNIIPKPQGESPTPYLSMLSKSDGELDFNQPADSLERLVRAYQPWPGTFTWWKGAPLKVLAAHPVKAASPGAGVQTIAEGKPAIGTCDGLLVLDQVQPAGKKPMSGEVFLRGARDWGKPASE